ncbi:MAG TPA: S9 family peptidase, partial [Edaphobacter sp.]|nr:S9 family peptidase [Edaphobacter sp.]
MAKRLAWVLTGCILGGSVALGQTTQTAPKTGASAPQSEPSATIVGEDPVPTSGRRPMTFADLQRMKRLSDPQISPSGRWVMFSATDVDLAANIKVTHLWVVPIGGGGEHQVTFWTEGESEGRFSPDGKHVAFVSMAGGKSSQVYIADWDEQNGKLGAPKQLTHVSTEADGPVWSPDSQRLLVVSRVYPGCSDEEVWRDEENCNRRRDESAGKSPVKAMTFDHLLYRHWDSYVGPKRRHILVVSATDGNAVRDLTPRHWIGDAEAPVFSLGGPIGYAWAPDSREIAFVTNLDAVPAASTNNDVFTLRLDGEGERPVKISTSPGGDDAPAYSTDGRWLAFRSQARAGYESDRFRLVAFDRQYGKAAATLTAAAQGQSRSTEQGPIRELLPTLDGWVDEFRWAPDSKTIYFVTEEMGEANVLSVGVDLPEATAIANKAEYSDLQIAPDGRTIITSLMTVRSPVAISAIPLNAQGRGGAPVVRLTHMNDAVLRQLELPRMESFMFPGAGNKTVQGFLLRPPGFSATRKYPMKFLIHGGPQGAWGDAW